MDESGEVAAWARQTDDQAASDRIDHIHEHHRYSISFSLQRNGRRRSHTNDHVWPLAEQLPCENRELIGVCRRPAIIERYIAAFNPSMFLEPLAQGRCIGLR